LLQTWPDSAKDAISLQKHLSAQFCETPFLGPLVYVAGVDISNERFSNLLHAAAVLARFDPATKSFETLAVGTSTRITTFPYVPGLLSFREGQVALEALAKLPRRPDLIVFDGHGRAHPRRYGIACHLGALTGAASLGCGKTHLVGDYEEPPKRRGCYSLLQDKAEELGVVLRTREAARPVFLSCGYGIAKQDLVRVMMELTDPRHRLCFVQRQAHVEANAIRRSFKEKTA
jgi:deoxyribonuclease V